MGSTVFVGTVASISPSFLDHWNLSRRQFLSEMVASEIRYKDENSPAALQALKKRFREAFADLPRPLAQRLDAARTHEALLQVFDSVLDGGRAVRFRVQTVFARGGDDDDSNDDDDDDETPQVIDVVTPFADCGYDFQLGETYLVFAKRDEDSNNLETSTCTATKRLSDAGQDLSYLYFFKMNPKSAGRLDGRAKYSPLFGLPGAAVQRSEDAPAVGLVIGIQSGNAVRYGVSDRAGKFVFDGLPPGDYSLNAWAPGYPDTSRLLGGPYQVRVGEKSCVERTIVIGPQP